MGIVPTSRQNNIMDALLGTAAFTAPVTGVKSRYDSTAPSASASGTELPNGSGYTTGGNTTTWNATNAGATSNITALSNTNTGSAWSVVGIEINDFSGNRFLYGNFTGQPISVPTGDTFAVAAGAITPNGSAW